MSGSTRALDVVVPRGAERQRLDKAVAAAAGVSRRVARLLIATGKVNVNGKPARILSREVSPGARLVIELDAPSAPAAAARSQRALPPGDLPILFLDRDLVAIDKPAGLLSESDREQSPSVESLLPGVLAARGERHRELKLVHRLDAGTSGVLVVACSASAAARLSKSFATGEAQKSYLAIVSGRLAADKTIDLPIGHKAGVKHGVTADGKRALTRVQVLAAGAQASLVLARPETGRTHQIRVHLAHLGHPLWGDRLYGGPGYTREAPVEPVLRAMLHAAKLVVPHPKTGQPLTLEATPPPDFVALARRLKVWPDTLSL